MREALGGGPFGNPEPSGACRHQGSKIGRISLNAVEPEAYGTLHRKGGPALQPGRCCHPRPGPRAPRRFSVSAALWALDPGRLVGGRPARPAPLFEGDVPVTLDPPDHSKRGIGSAGYTEAAAPASIVVTKRIPSLAATRLSTA